MELFIGLVVLGAAGYAFKVFYLDKRAAKNTGVSGNGREPGGNVQSSQ